MEWSTEKLKLWNDFKNAVLNHNKKQFELFVKFNRFEQKENKNTHANYIKNSQIDDKIHLKNSKNIFRNSENNLKNSENHKKNNKNIQKNDADEEILEF